MPYASLSTQQQMPLILLRPTAPPPLKWAGGKRWQLPHLRAYWEANQTRRLVEPFCGGLAVALGLNPTKALLNDVNMHLFNFYHQLKLGLDVTLRMKNDKDYYYKKRSFFNRLVRNPESKPEMRAQLFYYLNRTGFNGLCRFNKKGEFNVPFGRYTTIRYQPDFAIYSKVFANWEFSNRTFSSIPYKPTDFIYADPPYDVDFTSYSAGGFSWNDQIETAVLLSKHPGPVVLSNQATPRILELYRDLRFDLQLHDAPRRISCTGDRRPAKEVLATRNL